MTSAVGRLAFFIAPQDKNGHINDGPADDAQLVDKDDQRQLFAQKSRQAENDNVNHQKDDGHFCDLADFLISKFLTHFLGKIETRGINTEHIFA